MGRLLPVVFVAVLLAGGVLLSLRARGAETPPAPEPVPEEDLLPPAPDVAVRTYEIAEGDTFAKAVQEFGLSYATAMSILASAEDTYDFARIRVGRALRWEERLDGTPLRLVYEPDAERAIIVEPGETGGWTAREEPIEYDVAVVTKEGTVETSLFAAALNAGIPEAAVVNMVNAFAWSIDFATQTRQGDTFQILYEARTRDGRDAGPGRVLAASFTNAGRRSEAYSFEQEGKWSYYDVEGASLVRAFLRAPLSYSRISSGYTYSRFHPITQTNSPHRAIDYAAPMGTPIMAVADGTVTFAGWSGGYGNFIKIRHNATYGTNYAHLSRYATGIAAGARVTQGQVIGYVGSTGWSTGPHLHYEVTYNGVLVNPLEVQFPSGDPIADEHRPAFEARRDELRRLAGWGD